MALTGDAGTESDENYRCYGILYAQSASKVRSNVADYRRHDADPQDTDDEAQVTASDVWNMKEWCPPRFSKASYIYIYISKKKRNKLHKHRKSTWKWVKNKISVACIKFELIGILLDA